MFGTIARQGGHVQLEQSDMRLALNMAKIANGGFSQAAIKETEYLIKNPCAKVQDHKKQGVEFPGHHKVKAAIQRHPAMLRRNHTPGCLPCPNGTAKYSQTNSRRKGTGAAPPNRYRHQTAEPMPPRPKTSPASTSNSSKAQRLEIVNLPAEYVYSHTSLACAEFFTLNTSTQDCDHDTDFDPAMLPDEETSTG